MRAISLLTPDGSPHRIGHIVRTVAVGAALLLSACAGEPGGARYPEVAQSLPAVPAGKARIYFLRDYEPYESLARPSIYLNDRKAATSEPGGVSYRDVAPGRYEIKVDSPGMYPNQFKTVSLASGDVRYVKIESLRSWESSQDFSQDTFVVALIDPPEAQRELADMRYDARE